MKKTSKIEVRVPEHEKQAFIARCRARGVTVSDAIRGLMRKYPGANSRTLAVCSALVTMGGVAFISVWAINSDPAQAEPYSGMKSLFSHFDADADSHISFAEFMATYDDAVPEERVREYFEQKDVNNDQKISVEEFISAQITNERQSFNGLDRDRNGKLDLDEVTPREEDRHSENAHLPILSWTGAISGSEFRRGKTAEDAKSWSIWKWYWGEDGTIPEEYLTRVGQMFREYDENNDGWITEEEYIALASR